MNLVADFPVMDNAGEEKSGKWKRSCFMLRKGLASR
jgi:hypothetical protein